MDQQFSCACLNVRLKIKPGNDKQFSIVDTELVKDLFKQDLLQLTISLDSIDVKCPCLTTKKRCGDWITHRCDICHTYTHAVPYTSEPTRSCDVTHDGAAVKMIDVVNTSGVLQLAGGDTNRMTTVLLNKILLLDQIADLEQSSNYSQLYKIILPSDNDTTTSLNFSGNSAISSSSSSLPQCDKITLTSLESLASSFLVDQHAAMEERIRLYKEQEQVRYVELEQRILKEKNNMIATFLGNRTTVLSNDEDDTTTDNDCITIYASSASPQSHIPRFDVPQEGEGLRDGENFDGVRKVARDERGEVPLSNFSSPSSAAAQNTSPTKTRAEPVSAKIVQLALAQQPHADDDIFDFDPGFQDDPNQPLSESDVDEDENSATDDSSFTEDAQGPATSAVFSTSVPINVPVWKTARQQSIQARRENTSTAEDESVAPADVAASIQALARSVHDTSAEVFGELPKSKTRSTRRTISSQSSTVQE